MNDKIHNKEVTKKMDGITVKVMQMFSVRKARINLFKSQSLLYLIFICFGINIFGA